MNNSDGTTSIIESAGIKEEDKHSSTAPTDKYSNYEIEIESKESYDDALFTNSEELNDAIANGIKEAEPIHTNTKKKEKETEENPIDVQRIPPPKIDLSIYFSQHTNENKFKKGHHLFSKEGTHLPVIATSTGDVLITDYTNGTDIDKELFNDKLPVAIKHPAGNEQGIKKIASTIFSTTTYTYQRCAISLGIYFGVLLPKRIIDLDFNLAKLINPKKSGRIVSVYEVNKLFETKGIKPLALLEQSNKDLMTLSKANIPQGKRLRLLKAYELHIAQHIKQVINLFQKNCSSAKNSNYAALAEQAKLALRLIISNYKHCYYARYNTNNYLYGIQRAKSNNIASKLIDWLCLEQQLCTATQSITPQTSIKTLNTLFYVLGQYEPGLIKKELNTITRELTSILHLYLSYQAIQLIDLHQLSSRLHKPLLDFIYANLSGISIVNFNNNRCSADYYIPLYHDSSALSTHVDNDKRKSSTNIQLNISDYFDRIIKQKKQLLETLGSRTKQANNHQISLTLINALSKTIEQAPSLKPNFSLYDKKEMSVFITIDSCYTLAHYKYTLNLKENGIKDVNLPKHPKSAQSPWGAAYEDDKLIYLQTHEPQCAVNFDVGYPLLMLDKSTDTQELGVITDIERTQALHINFTVSKITQHFTGVQIKSDGNPTTKAIIYTHQGRYFLMCVNNDLFWKGKTIEIEDLENNQRVICIKALLCDYGRTKIYETF